ncbi:MAG TPA: Gfo/Idh/MocA family oxidoreductase [Gemmataceae bacterium]|jgi:predicted dehydrogenase|nr:Gfo/Idh/MocA family oxidoreductase [Gemmataceae bacterium]
MQTPPSQSPLSRRAFVRGGAAAVLSAATYGRVVGANARVGIGFIGFGLIGKRHVMDFRDQPDTNLVAVAEVHRGRLDEATTFIGGSVKGHGDFRKLLDDRHVDAVVVSTPDHWHALMTMLSCAAGKDVYVEKPLTLFVREGRWMVDVARRHHRVVQVGTQQRSGPHYQRARELIRDGHLGKVCSVRMQAYRNIMPGYGAPPDQDPPRQLDWNLFLGPAPYRRYNPNRALYHFRWFWDYSGGQMTNLGQHALDIAHWCLGASGPRSVASMGGRYNLRDNGETPDTQDALFEYDGWTAIWSHREASRGPADASPLEFFGTKGSLAISRRGFVLTPDRKVAPANTVPQFTGAHPVGGPVAVKESGPPQYWTKPVKDHSGDARAQFQKHVRNFLDCVKSRRQPVSDLESGHRVATACHLANIALRLGRGVRWDADKEQVVDDPEAAKMLVRHYRAPWDSELKALHLG